MKDRETLTQVGLSASERSLNLIDAFVVRPGVALPDQVILIDDVATTGSTLSECARALRRAGVQTGISCRHRARAVAIVPTISDASLFLDMNRVEDCIQRRNILSVVALERDFKRARDVGEADLAAQERRYG